MRKICSDNRGHLTYVDRARAYMPAGTVPPFIMRFDAGAVPVGDLVFTDESGRLSVNDLQDMALFRVRPLFATLPGLAASTPFGGSPRAVVISVDPDRLRAYNMSPDEIVEAIAKGNTISPSGNVRIGDQIPMVPVNSVVSDVKHLGDVPIRSDGTRTIFVRDLATISDSADTEVGYALVNGHRTVYMPVTKRADASTLSVVNLVKENLPRFQAVLPEGVRVKYEFDQSPFVTRAISSLIEEGALGAVLTGLMVLLFLQDWRSALVVVVNIPLAILAATIALAMSGQTVNLMTLGGLALAVGILVDQATVVAENVHSHRARAATLSHAAYDGTREMLAPNFLAMLCILGVFISAFFMRGAAHNLFIPLAMSVGFAMVASYVLSATLVPVLLVWILRTQHGDHVSRSTRFDVFRNRYCRFGARVVELRWIVVPAYLVATGLIIVLVAGRLGQAIFPTVDEGQFTLRLRAPAGTRIEKTEYFAKRALDIIGREAGPGNVALTIGFVGVQHPAYPINSVYLWTSGPEEAVLQVQLNRKANIRVSRFEERLRRVLARDLPGIYIRFEASDIVSQVMSFGAPTPIEVAVSGPDFPKIRAFAVRLENKLSKVASLRDLGFEQELDFPAIKVDIDRQMAGMLGVSVRRIARSLTEATSSSRYTAANFWSDPKSGIGYRIQVEVPPHRMNSLEQIRNIPVSRNKDIHLSLRNLADIRPGTVVGEYDRYNMERMLTLAANISGEDLGAAAREVSQAIAAVGSPPRGVSVALRGQLVPMRKMFKGLGLGLAVAVVAIFLLLAANFESFRLALAVLLTVPAVIVGVALALWITGTTLNIQSVMGTIMAIGVAVANAILLVTFAERSRLSGCQVRDAVMIGAASRLRPILMTSCAMIAGMLPMAAGFGEGGAQTAPLGRAVVGGLIGATIATLVILPAIFALLQSDRARKSSSLLPPDGIKLGGLEH